MPAAEAKPFALPELPVSILIDALEVREISLGEPVIGVPATLSLTAAARLDGDGLDARFNASRVDGRDGRFALAAAFARDTEALNIDLSLEEGPNGIVATIILLG